MNNIKIKICGIKNTAILDCCNNLKVDYFGLVFFKTSPRNININNAKNLINKIDQLSLENKELSTKVNINLELEKSIENIQMKIKKILKKFN